jgi:hypothetical protein
MLAELKARTVAIESLMLTDEKLYSELNATRDHIATSKNEVLAVHHTFVKEFFSSY